MSDLISRQAAIDAICEHGTDLERRGITVLSVANHKQVTVDVLENLPSAQPVDKDINVPTNDTISRQAAIRSAHKNYDTILDFKSDGRTVADSFEDIINTLPPAQPEIIRCEDCKWCEEKYDSLDKTLYWRCRNWDGETDADGFCYEAERRTDE